MKAFVLVFICLSLSPVAAGVVADLEVYLGSFEGASQPEVVISLSDTHLTPAMGLKVVDEIKKTFNLKEMILLSAPRMEIMIGKEAMILQTLDNPEWPVNRLGLKFKIQAINQGVAHAFLGFNAEGGPQGSGDYPKRVKETDSAEFFARLGEPFTLARRLDGHVLFILCTIRDSAKEMLEPKLLKKVNPIYPPAMKESRVSGTVVLRIHIDKDGRPQSVEVTKSVAPELDQAAVDAVKQWQWEPASKAGTPVDVWTDITIRFHLEK